MIISKKPPYESTEVTPEKSQSQINQLLKEYGVSKYQWTTDYENNQVVLAFELEVEIGSQKRRLTFKVSPPPFAKKRRTWDSMKGYRDVYAANWAQSYRLLYFWLKAKLESVAYGLTTAEQEFLSQMVLPQGKTLGEILKDPEQFGKLALEEKTVEKEAYAPPDAIEGDVS
jgi:hypothetical protein